MSNRLAFEQLEFLFYSAFILMFLIMMLIECFILKVKNWFSDMKIDMMILLIIYFCGCPFYLFVLLENTAYKT